MSNSKKDYNATIWAKTAKEAQGRPDGVRVVRTASSVSWQKMWGGDADGKAAKV